MTSIVRSDIGWVLIATALMMASMFLRAELLVLDRPRGAAAPTAAPPRRHLGDDDRGADVGDPAGPPRRAGARDGARAAHRPDARDVPGAARHARLAERAQHRRAGAARRRSSSSSTDLFHSSSERLFLFSLAPLLLLVAVVLAPDCRPQGRLRPGGARDRDDPRRPAQGAHAGSSSSAIRAAARPPRSPSSAPGRSSCSPATRCSRRSGSTAGRDRRRGRGALRGQRHRGGPGDAVEHRRLPARRRSAS